MGFRAVFNVVHRRIAKFFCARPNRAVGVYDTCPGCQGTAVSQIPASQIIFLATFSVSFCMCCWQFWQRVPRERRTWRLGLGIQKHRPSQSPQTAGCPMLPGARYVDRAIAISFVLGQIELHNKLTTKYPAPGRSPPAPPISAGSPPEPHGRAALRL